MGVTGLWTVVQPCARPIKLETLNKKRLAVDASIWIYQFLKAVRDKEGNALRNSHIVGFFRRICKLLYFGIKPVFVFDGGAPALKRQTISARKQRREGRREDAVRTAGKLLAVQMQRRAEEEENKRKEAIELGPAPQEDEEEVPDDLVYVDELQMTSQERQQSRHFKKKDAYHLPDLDISLESMGAPNDPRIMSHEELEEYARQFHTGEDINLYDFSKIDFNSPFFLSLPASDRYNILNAARLRSRLRMGYSKEQLDDMFPNRMAFSKFQVERVKERNDLTQRLMNINGMNGEDAMLGNGGSRVAGERGKEYVLVKNEGVEGGWALGVVSNNKDDGKREKPIDLESRGQLLLQEEDDDEWDDADDGFENVPIEGLNVLPKRLDIRTPETAGQRQAFRGTREKDALRDSQVKRKPRIEDPDSLFLANDEEDYLGNVDVQNVDGLFDGNQEDGDEEAQLRRAIEMSLSNTSENDRDSPAEVQDNTNAIPSSTLDSTRNAMTFHDQARNDVDNMDFHAAIAESRKSKYQSRVAAGKPSSSRASPASKLPSKLSDKPSSFRGPLPFENINLGKSIFGRKKAETMTAGEEGAGGFEREGNDDPRRKVQPLPPWFSGGVGERKNEQLPFPDKENNTSRPFQRDPSEILQVLSKDKANDVVELDPPGQSRNEMIEINSDVEAEDTGTIEHTIPVDSEVRMGDVADLTRVEPPRTGLDSNPIPETSMRKEKPSDVPTAEEQTEEFFDWDASDKEEPIALRTGNPTVARPAGGERQNSSGLPSPDLENVEFENIGVSVTSPQPTQSDVVAIPSLPTQDSIDQGILDEDIELDGVNSDPEDDDLMRQLAVEAEEHARFASTLNQKSQLQNAEDYERELRQLRNQQKKDRRDADEVSHIMVTECQQLLRLFGLPYVTAPMEAEAQCAELVSLGLVDGIVTDDSDTFLFGGTRVYKNMFNQAKFVECYLSSDLEKEFSLDREHLIGIAHLLGSDYTEGLPNVGPVTALEILSEFGTLDAFRDWWAKVQMGVKLPEDAASPFRKKFRRNATKLFLSPTFPDRRVDEAYLHPEVDSDPSPFAWGVPDLDALRSFLMSTIGWTQERTDEVLVPVIKDMNRRENEGTQANITNFFSGGSGAGAFAPRRRNEGKSKRMENALGKLQQQAKRRRVMAGASSSEAGPAATSSSTSSSSEVGSGDEREESIKRRPISRKRKATKKTTQNIKQ
ncbi:MAG: hypothetical protein M1819_002970 [Sarea resinae]|nr:MAG: hypothetical protein M1819_002970 [Sarea resinae]